MSNKKTQAENISNYDKIQSLYQVASYDQLLTATILLLGLTTAALEGIGLGFILPIVEYASGGGEPSGLVAIFKSGYNTIGIPFTLEYIILGVGIVLAVRYTASFGVEWLLGVLQASYVRHLRDRAFSAGVKAKVAYFDQMGSDEILNAIITQTQYAGRAIRQTVKVIRLSLIACAYLLVAMLIAPWLTILTGIVLGGFMIGIRQILESGMSVGDRVADANERVQETVQAGMQGIRAVKLFNIENELYSDFQQSIDQFVDSKVDQWRNKAAIRNLNQFATAAAVFGLIYAGLKIFSLSLGSLGVFLFAMFRLGPTLSNLNNEFYGLETELPHLVRTQRFTDSLQNQCEVSSGDPVSSIHSLSFENVKFAYDTSNKQVLDGISFTVERGEFIGFVGQSGSGKSTIVSLLVRLYDVDEGSIQADGTPITEFDLSDWREQISVVRQDPHIFNDTLRRNITIGNRNATHEEIRQVAEIAAVTEFLDDLPNGYDTQLGDDGVRLSGGQRQRVAIARALLKDADLLVLDEATSDLDSHLENKVQQSIEAMDQDYGIIAVAHRLSTLTDAERIYMMDDGRIVESGCHKELLQKGGQYTDLYAQQS